MAYRVATGRDRDRVRSVHAALLAPVEEDPGSRPTCPDRVHDRCRPVLPQRTEVRWAGSRGWVL
ncbi:hypothetical protein GCM10007079_30950 [Nocardiopsis terrae]|nr:hypothetical protein GCM10007079_30950 [Nocardiopsis terrae]